MTMTRQWMSGSNLEVLQLRRGHGGLDVQNSYHDRQNRLHAQVGGLNHLY